MRNNSCNYNSLGGRGHGSRAASDRGLLDHGDNGLAGSNRFGQSMRRLSGLGLGPVIVSHIALQAGPERPPRPKGLYLCFQAELHRRSFVSWTGGQDIFRRPTRLQRTRKPGTEARRLSTFVPVALRRGQRILWAFKSQPTADRNISQFLPVGLE